MLKGSYQLNRNLKICLRNNLLGNLEVMVHKNHQQKKKLNMFQEVPLPLKKSQTLTKNPLPPVYRDKNLSLAEEANQDATQK